MRIIFGNGDMNEATTAVVGCAGSEVGEGDTITKPVR